MELLSNHMKSVCLSPCDPFHSFCLCYGMQTQTDWGRDGGRRAAGGGGAGGAGTEDKQRGSLVSAASTEIWPFFSSSFSLSCISISTWEGLWGQEEDPWSLSFPHSLQYPPSPTPHFFFFFYCTIPSIHAPGQEGKCCSMPALTLPPPPIWKTKNK